MAFTQNAFPTFPKQPRLWPCAIGNGDASSWKPGVVAGPNGSKVNSANIVSNDTATRVIQMGLGRGAAVTCTSASPGVFTWSVHPLAVGDQVVLGGTAVQTGFTAGTTYFVAATSFAAGATFTLAATAG